METVGPNGEFIDHFEGRTLNPGHAMEKMFEIQESGIRNFKSLVAYQGVLIGHDGGGTGYSMRSEMFISEI